MKKIAFAFLLSTVIFGACKKDNDPITSSTQPQLGIDVQSYFKQAPVQVSVDGKQVINTTLTTNLSSGYAPGGKILIPITVGGHQISTTVNNDVTNTENFIVSKDHYIGINYDSLTNTVRFMDSDIPFVYR